jgi:hypothetical protein
MIKKNAPKAISPNGQRSCRVFTTRMICIIIYTNISIPETRYSTTNRPIVCVGPRPAHDLKVANETKPVMTNIAKLIVRRSQTDNVVPSSYSWNPTNPLMSKHTQSADVRPFCTAAKYGYALLPGGMTPESRMSEAKDSSM